MLPHFYSVLTRLHTVTYGVFTFLNQARPQILALFLASLVYIYPILAKCSVLNVAGGVGGVGWRQVEAVIPPVV